MSAGLTEADPTGVMVHRKYMEARALRDPHVGDWREVFERLGLTESLNGLNSAQSTLNSLRNPKNFIDAKAALAHERYGAMLEMMFTPRQQKWHNIRTTDASLNRRRRVRLYFEEVRDALFTHRYRAQSGFSTAQQETYQSLGAVGFGTKLIEKADDRRGITYRALDPSRCYVLTGKGGRTSHHFRELDLNARQSAEEFGTDKLPKRVRDELTKAGGPSETVTFRYVHMVGPNNDPGRSIYLDERGLPFKSCYVHEETKKVVRESGYRSWPIPVARVPTKAEAVYGRSPAMKAMGPIKTANAMKVTLLKQGQRTADPVILTHDDGVLDTFDMRPGAQNRGGVSPDGKPLVHTLPIGRVDIGHDLLDREHRDINDFFYVTLFLLLMETPEMTATEVIQRLRERGALLAPIGGKLEDEDLAVTIDRELDVLAEQRLIPPMPPELVEAGGEYELLFDNPFNRAQQSDEVTSYLRLRDIASQWAAVTKDPRPLQRFNDDRFLPEAGQRLGIPERWMRSDEEMEALDEQNQQQQQMATAIEAAPAIAGLAKATSNAAA